MPKFPEHDPNSMFTNEDLYKDDAAETELEIGLTPEQKQDRLRIAQSLKNVFVYDPDGSINKEKTINERDRLIFVHQLKKTELYARTLKIGKDEQGLPILTAKK